MPDARSKMAIGAGQASGMTLRKEGYTGGDETKDLRHSHGVGTLDIGECDGIAQDQGGGANTCAVDPHEHPITGSTAYTLTNTEDIMNPWFALWMIIKY
jgi:hypothetical protein